MHKNSTKCKQNTKQMMHKQAWSIKNYRYVWDVSVPKFIIDWFMIMVLLVLKLLVSSHPLNFEGVIWIYVLLLHEGQAEYHFAMFSLCSKQTNNFQCIIVYDIFCVTFYVVTWLLSSIVRIISFMPMFRVLWSQLAMLYMTWSRLCWLHVTSKIIIIFCYHLPTRGRAGVKLGDAWYVANVSIIFDASCLFYTNCFMFCLHFVTFLCIFWN
jgi:hypothetical protein